MGNEVDFMLQINTEVFNKLILSLYVCIARHGHITQNNNFSMSLQDPEENMKGEVDFLPADRPQFFLLIDIIILGVCDQACVNYPPKSLFLCSICSK